MFTFSRYKWTRFWGVWDPEGELVCVCVYKKGARKVVGRLNGGQ